MCRFDESWTLLDSCVKFALMLIKVHDAYDRVHVCVMVWVASWLSQPIGICVYEHGVLCVNVIGLFHATCDYRVDLTNVGVRYADGISSDACQQDAKRMQCEGDWLCENHFVWHVYMVRFHISSHVKIFSEHICVTCVFEYT